MPASSPPGLDTCSAISGGQFLHQSSRLGWGPVNRFVQNIWWSRMGAGEEDRNVGAKQERGAGWKETCVVSCSLLLTRKSQIKTCGTRKVWKKERKRCWKEEGCRLKRDMWHWFVPGVVWQFRVCHHSLQVLTSRQDWKACMVNPIYGTKLFRLQKSQSISRNSDDFSWIPNKACFLVFVSFHEEKK